MADTGQWPPEGDPYDMLGVGSEASAQEIVRAYHRAAHRAHPDAQPGDPQAHARFRALTEAYDLLRDPERRAGYDRAQQRVAGQDPRTGERRAATHRPARFWPGAMVWAGPVHVQPPGENPGVTGRPGTDHGGSPAAAGREPGTADARHPGSADARAQGAAAGRGTGTAPARDPGTAAGHDATTVDGRDPQSAVHRDPDVHLGVNVRWSWPW